MGRWFRKDRYNCTPARKSSETDIWNIDRDSKNSVIRLLKSGKIDRVFLQVLFTLFSVHRSSEYVMSDESKFISHIVNYKRLLCIFPRNWIRYSSSHFYRFTLQIALCQNLKYISRGPSNSIHGRARIHNSAPENAPRNSPSQWDLCCFFSGCLYAEQFLVRLKVILSCHRISASVSHKIEVECWLQSGEEFVWNYNFII